jgi:hypothetical protein
MDRISYFQCDQIGHFLSFEQLFNFGSFLIKNISSATFSTFLIYLIIMTKNGWAIFWPFLQTSLATLLFYQMTFHSSFAYEGRDLASLT